MSNEKRKSRTQSLKEAIFGTPEPLDIKEGTAVVSKVEQDYGIRPKNSFANQVKVFDKDALVREACIRQAAEIISAGFFVEIDKSYTVTLPRPPEGDEEKSDKIWTAKEALDYFNESNNLDEILTTICIELVAYGNSFVSISDGLRIIPLSAIEKGTKRSKLNPVSKEYNLKLTYPYQRKGKKELKWGEFLHFRCNMTSDSAPFGTGIITNLLESYTDGAPTPMQLRGDTTKNLMDAFRKIASSNSLWIFEELPDEKIGDVKDEESLAYKIKNMSGSGNRIATNKKGNIVMEIPQRTNGFEEWLKSTKHEFNSILEDPSLKIQTESILTKGTAETDVRLFKKKILGMQRILKRQVELLWKKMLNEYGFDPKKAKPRLNFGMESVPEYQIDDILKAFEAKLISKEEARKMMREARWKLEEGDK